MTFAREAFPFKDLYEEPGPTALAVLAAFSCLASLAIVHFVTGSPAVPADPFLKHSDLAVDWVTVKAAWDGIDPYMPIQVLLDHYQVAGARAGLSPETPAAFIIQYPLRLLDLGLASVVFDGLALLSLLAVAVLCASMARLDFRYGLIAAPVVVGSIPATQALNHGNIMILFLPLLAFSWVRVLQGDSPLAGFALGIVAAVRLWPALLAVGFLVHKRWKAAFTAIVVVLLSNLAGLAAPGVSPAAALGGLLEGGEFWVNAATNASLAATVGWRSGVHPGALVLVGAVGTVILMLTARAPDGAAIGIATAGGLLASPLAWPVYFLSLLPGVPLVMRHPRVRPLGALALVLIVSSGAGLPLTTAALAMLVSFVWLAYQGRTEDSVGERKKKPMDPLEPR